MPSSTRSPESAPVSAGRSTGSSMLGSNQCGGEVVALDADVDRAAQNSIAAQSVPTRTTTATSHHRQRLTSNALVARLTSTPTMMPMSTIVTARSCGRLNTAQYHATPANRQQHSGVAVGVGAVGHEGDRVARADLVRDAVDLHGQLAVDDQQQLAGAGWMGLGLVAVARGQAGVPQLDLLPGARADQQPVGAARRAAPEGDRLVGPDDPGAGHLGGLGQAGHRDPEGVGEAADGRDARVGPGLLDLVEHPLADAGAGGQLLEGPGEPGAPGPDVAADRGVDLVWLGHVACLSDSNKLIDTVSIVKYNRL